MHCDPYPAIDPSHFDLLGKAVLITGASRGLGRAMVLAFAAAGASKIAAGARGDTALLRDAINSCASANGHAKPGFLPLTLDVSDDASVAAAAVAIKAEFGRLDIVINNAGVLGAFGKVGDTDPDQWWRVFQVNLLGPYLVSRAMIPLLREAEHSYVIHVASGGAHLVNPGLSAYQTSKLALLRFSQLLHREYAETGVTSFAVHPGNCPTDIMGPGELDEFHKSSTSDYSHYTTPHDAQAHPFSIHGQSGFVCAVSGVPHRGAQAMAWWQICELHVGFARVDGPEGRNHRRRQIESQAGLLIVCRLRLLGIPRE